MVVLALDMVVLLYALPSTLINWKIVLTGKTYSEEVQGLFDDREDDGSKKDDQDEL